ACVVGLSASGATNEIVSAATDVGIGSMIFGSPTYSNGSSTSGPAAANTSGSSRSAAAGGAGSIILGSPTYSNGSSVSPSPAFEVTKNGSSITCSLEETSVG